MARKCRGCRRNRSAVWECQARPLHFFRNDSDDGAQGKRFRELPLALHITLDAGVLRSPLRSRATRSRGNRGVRSISGAVARRTVTAQDLDLRVVGSADNRKFPLLYAIAPRLRLQTAGCSTDGARACDTAGRVSRVVLWISAGIYLLGFFVSYVLGPALMRLDS